MSNVSVLFAHLCVLVHVPVPRQELEEDTSTLHLNPHNSSSLSLELGRAITP